MVGRQAAQALGRVTLVSGPEEFLAEREVRSVRAAVRDRDADAELSQTTADQLTMATLGELAAPSLFSTTRCVVVQRLEDLPEDSVPGLLDYAAAPAADVALVLVHSGGQKGSGVLTRLRRLDSVTEVRTTTPKGREYAAFVAEEFGARRVRIDPDAADQLVRAVGHDLRGLAAATDQLAADFEGRAITREMVARYFAGRAETKSFAIADAALSGETARALEELRWALDTGTAPVLITSALASGLRGLAKLRSATRGLREPDLAREVGVPPWKLRDLRQQARGWHTGELGRAIRAVAGADADIKGRAAEATHALEQLVLTVSRGGRSAG